jgi:glycosyltransferase involved in cell wall biosynthesis
MPEPLISVVIPVHNGEAFLDQAIESALGQTWPRTEVVVVDDGSSDRSAEIASSYPVTLVRQDKQGIAAARNRGAETAGGELLSFLDQDDLFLPEKLERQLEALRAAPEAGICACRLRLFLEPGHPLPGRIHPPLLDSDHHSLQVGTMLVWRRAFEQVGAFDESYRWGNDMDWLVRAREAGVPIAMLDDSLLRHRIHDRNESRRQRAMVEEALQVLRASARRKRHIAEHD